MRFSALFNLGQIGWLDGVDVERIMAAFECVAKMLRGFSRTPVSNLITGAGIVNTQSLLDLSGLQTFIKASFGHQQEQLATIGEV